MGDAAGASKPEMCRGRDDVLALADALAQRSDAPCVQPSTQTQMKKSVLILAGLSAWCAGMLFMPTPASAGDAPEKCAVKTIPVSHRNEQYDLNKDGKLDEQEHAAMKADRAAKRQARLLAKYDANKNGTLDVDEQAKCDADRAVRREKAKERRKAKAAEKAAAAATAPAPEEDEEEETEPHKP